MKINSKKLFCITLCMFLCITFIPTKTFAFSEWNTQVGSSTSKNFKVTFDANGGTVSTKNKNVTSESAYGTLPTPKRKNFDFQGWYTLKAGGNRISEYSTVTLDADQTLYAHWLGSAVTVTLDPTGGVLANTTYTARYGIMMINLPVPTKTNYVFDGWYTSATKGNVVTDSTIFTTSMKKTLYAHWKDKKLSLEFIPWNGEDAYVIQVSCGKAFGKLPVPKKPGKTFQGWYTQADYSNVDAKPVTETTIATENGPTTFLARWY